MAEGRDVDTVVKDIENVLESNAPEDQIEKEIRYIFAKKFSKEFSGLQSSSRDASNKSVANLDDLPDTVLLKIFSSFELPELCHVALVCKHWLWIVYDSELWRYVDLSKYKQINERHIVNLIQARLSPLLKSLDLSNREITPVIMNELSEHCQQLDTLVLQNCLMQDSQTDEISNLSTVPEKLVRLDVRNFKQGPKNLNIKISYILGLE
uniref:F-box domain-containing protein n=1 Tax=Clytia hemisphaerica TaxID=252671 RepID=A0A7M5XFA7_9CNID